MAPLEEIDHAHLGQDCPPLDAVLGASESLKCEFFLDEQNFLHKTTGIISHVKCNQTLN